MNERQLYDAHRDAVLRFTGVYLEPWQYLTWAERQVWERHAAEQHERDETVREAERHWRPHWKA